MLFRSGAGDIARQGAERAEVTASFSALPQAALTWLTEQSIDFDGELVVRRVIGADGRSRAYVNGQVVPLQALRQLAEFLLEIHGQQEFQHLVSRAAQRELLDERLGTTALKNSVAEAFEHYSTSRRELEALQTAAANEINAGKDGGVAARMGLARFLIGSEPKWVMRSPSRGGLRPRSCTPFHGAYSA